jgi:hypothetical protein
LKKQTTTTGHHPSMGCGTSRNGYAQIQAMSSLVAEEETILENETRLQVSPLTPITAGATAASSAVMSATDPAM